MMLTALRNEPIDKMLPNEPIEPIEKIDPTEPIDMNEFLQPMHKNEFVEAILHLEVDGLVMMVIPLKSDLTPRTAPTRSSIARPG